MFRVDAGPRFGAGHVMRCGGLARTLKARGWSVAFAVARPALAATAPFVAAEFAVEALDCPDGEADEARELARRHGAGIDLLVVDHYGRGAAFEAACRPWAGRILAFEDVPGRRHDCDFLLDQTVGRTAAEYDGLVAPTRGFLLGAPYVQIRDEFRAYDDWDRPIAPRAARLLVTFGAADPARQTERTLCAVAGMDLEIRAVVGAGNDRRAAIEELAAANPGVTVVADPAQMSEQMAWADIAVGAAGSTCWEFAVMGLPALVMVCADNQAAVAERLDRAGTVRSLGAFQAVADNDIRAAVADLMEDEDSRRTMSAAGRALIDGRGRERAVQAIEGDLT